MTDSADVLAYILECCDEIRKHLMKKDMVSAAYDLGRLSKDISTELDAMEGSE